MNSRIWLIHREEGGDVSLLSQKGATVDESSTLRDLPTGGGRDSSPVLWLTGVAVIPRSLRPFCLLIIIIKLIIFRKFLFNLSLEYIWFLFVVFVIYLSIYFNKVVIIIKIILDFRYSKLV